MSKNINKQTRLKVFNKYNGKCSYCGCEILANKFHVDHIEAKFRGTTSESLEQIGRKKGSDSIENLNPSCASCNSSKSTFTLEQWRNEIGLKIKRIERDSSTFRILNRFGLISINDKPVTFYFEDYEKGI